MRLRAIVGLVVIAVVLTSSLVCAAGASEPPLPPLDLTYWYLDDQGHVQSQRNGAPPANLLVTLEQDVYGPGTAPDQTAGMLVANGDPAYEGYLFSYTLTNIAWDHAITKFSIDWQGVQPLFVTLDHSQEPDPQMGHWTAYQDGPRWTWEVGTGGGAGITSGGTAMAFWAVAGLGAVTPDGKDREVLATAGTSDPETELRGWTTGPVPEPIGIVSLLLGVGGLAATRLRRK